MLKMSRYLLAVATFALAIGTASAHSGRTDVDGCHQDKKNQDRHCHGDEESSKRTACSISKSVQ